MNTLYTFVLIAAAVIGGAALALAVAFALWPRVPPYEGSQVVVAVAALFALFLVVTLLLRWLNGGPFCMPVVPWLHRTITYTTLAVAIAWGIYGVVHFPAAPLKDKAGAIVDKRGHAYSRQAYETFRRWDSSLPLVWLPVALVAITGAGASVGKAVRYC